MHAPNYDMMPMDEPADDDADSPLPARLQMLADKLGFDAEKAQALKDFIKECSESDYSDEDTEV